MADLDSPRPMEPNKKERWLRVVSSILASVFIIMGLAKWIGQPTMVQMFKDFTFPPWMLPLVGTLEVGFAVFTFIPATRGYGALGLAGVMIGAAITHIMTGVMLPMLFVNLALFLAAAWIVTKQRPPFLSPRMPRTT